LGRFVGRSCSGVVVVCIDRGSAGACYLLRWAVWEKIDFSSSYVSQTPYPNSLQTIQTDLLGTLLLACVYSVS
jgi:hypothetical protein